jgi:hypothetical protein
MSSAGEQDERPLFPDEQHSRIWFSTPTEGAVYGHMDEVTTSGFAMSVSEATGLQAGDKLVVGIADWLIPALVRDIMEAGGGSSQLMLDWARPTSNAVSDILEHCHPAD